MDVIVNDELQAYIDPLTADEFQALERSILSEGCRDALVLWGDMLIDGHNRYRICRQHGLPFQTVQSTRFQTMADVHLWMIDQHLGRRSLSDFQRGVLALRKREIVAERSQRATPPAAAETAPTETASPATFVDALDTKEALAKAARLSSNQITLIEKIQRQATPEVVAAVKAGTLSINAAAAVSSLPPTEQVAAAAVGKDELKLAAKRVRESKRKQPVQAPASDAPQVPLEVEESIQTLRLRVAALEAENQALREQIAQWQARMTCDTSTSDSQDASQAVPF